MMERKEKSEAWYRKRTSFRVFFALSMLLLVAAIGMLLLKRKEIGTEAVRQEMYVQDKSALENLNYFIRAAESAIRGFCFSGDSRLLPGYNQMEDSILSTDYRHYYANDQMMIERNGSLFIVLDSLVHQKVVYMQKIKELSLLDVDAARLLFIGGRGEALADSIASVSNHIIRNYEEFLAETKTAHVRNNRILSNMAIISILLCMALTSLAFYHLSKQNKANDLLKKSLQEQNEYLYSTLSSMTEGVITTDPAGNVAYMNPAAEKITGWALQETLQEPVKKVYTVKTESSGQPLKDIVTRVILDEKPVLMENNTILTTKAGKEIIIRNSGVPLFTADHKMSGALLVFSDITEKKLAEKKLQHQEKYFRDIMENIPHPIYTVDADGNLKYYNKAALELWGQIPDTSNPWWCSFLNLHDCMGCKMDQDECPLYQTLRTKQAVRGEQIMIQKKDGSMRFIIPHPTPLFDEKGNLAGAINMLLDFTEDRNREIQIQTAEEKYKSLIDQASDGIITYSLDGKIYEFNKAAHQNLGYTKEEFSLLSMQQLLADGPIILNPEKMEKVLRGEQEFFYRILRKKDGSTVDVEANPRLLPDGRLLAIVRDITERKHAESEIQDISRRLSMATSAGKIGIWELDISSDLMIIDRQMEEIYGLKGNQFSGKGNDLLQLIHPEDLPILTSKLEEAKNQKKELNSSFRIIRPDGVTRYVRSIGAFLVDENNNPVKMIGINLDITAYKLLVLETQKALERYEILAKATSDTIWDWDIPKKRILYNDGINTMFGYEKSNVTDAVDWWKGNIHPDDCADVELKLNQLFENRESTIELEYRYKCADGSYKYIYDRAFVIYDTQGQPIRMIGAMQNVTRQQEEEQGISKAIVNAQENERRQLGMELHDNVNQILSVSMLYMSMAEDKQRKEKPSLKDIEQSKEYVSTAIAEIRKLSHQLAPASFEDVTLHDAMQSLINSMNAQKKFNITLDADQISGDQLTEDVQVSLYRILQEQMNNILKHSEANKATVQIRFESGSIIMKIQDNGKGFDATQKMKGIGFENMRRRARSFGGNIHYESAPGNGCTLTVVMPAGQSQ